MKPFRCPWCRPALIFLTLILVSVALQSCAVYPQPVATVVNPETFPQPVLPEAPPVPSEIPPPVTENRTFVTIDGIPQYKIGAGDVLEVFFTKGPAQERILAPVRANGRVTVSYSEVSVGGLTADQAAAEITKALSVYYRKPVIDVQVKEYNSKKVSVIGAIAAAVRGGIGTIPLTGRMTLIELISRAGGLAPNAGIERVRVTSESGKAYTVNLYRYVQEGDLSQDFIMDAGDAVFVPERAPGEDPRVFMLGEVKVPGPVPYFPNLTLSRLIAAAGGWSDTALFHEARIIRGDLRNPEIISIDLARLVLDGDRRIDQLLRPNDLVFVPRLPITNWNVLLAHLRPTLEFITLPFTAATNIKTTQDLFK
jgi:protein involved in polysaccharide export with SLBB domain